MGPQLGTREIALVVGLGAGLAGAALAAEPLAWLAAALALFCLVELGRALSRGAAGRPVRALAGPVAVAAVLAAVTSDLWLEGVPLARDHPVHLYKTWLLVHDLLPSGRLWGWSDRLYAGLPLNEGYPFLPYLWAGGAHLLTFGLVGLESSYAAGQVGLFALLSLGAYLWGRRLGGPLAGASAAVFVLADPGAFRGGGREGGWTYFFQIGVWPQALAIALALLAGLALAEALGRDRPSRWVALSGLLGAAAALAHPLGVVPVVGLHAALLAGHLLAPAPGRGAGRLLLSVAGSAALAALLAAPWYAVFLASGEVFLSTPGSWRDLDDLAAGLLRGELFLDAWAVPGVLAIAGAALLARRRTAEDLAVLGFVLASVLLASPQLLGALAGESLPAPLASLQLDRLAMHAKPLVMAMAGLALAALARLAREELWPRGLAAARATGPRDRAAVALVCLAVSPLALWGARRAGALLPEVGQAPSLADLEEGPELERLSAWLRERAAAEREPTRLALRQGPGRPRVVEELFLVAARAGVSVHSLSETPADTFAHRSHGGSPEELRALGVRLVASRGPLDRGDLRLVESFGPYRLYEVSDFDPSRLTVLGPGRATTRSREDERLRIDLAGTGPETRLLVHLSPHPRWRATIEGERVELRPSPRPGGATFTEVVRPRDGLLELRYGGLPGDRAGLALGLAGLLLLAGLLSPPGLVRRAGAPLALPLGRLAPALGRLRPLALPAGVAALLLAAGLVLTARSGTDRPGRDLVSELRSAELTARIAPPCRTLGLCRVPSIPAVRVVRGFEGRLEPCIRLSAPTAGLYALAFPEGRAGPRLRGAWYWAPGPRAEREVRPEPLATSAPAARILVGRAVHELPAGPAGRWRAFDLPGAEDPARVTVELASASPGRLDACFRLAAR